MKQQVFIALRHGPRDGESLDHSRYKEGYISELVSYAASKLQVSLPRYVVSSLKQYAIQSAEDIGCNHLIDDGLAYSNNDSELIEATPWGANFQTFKNEYRNGNPGVNDLADIHADLLLRYMTIPGSGIAITHDSRAEAAAAKLYRNPEVFGENLDYYEGIIMAKNPRLTPMAVIRDQEVLTL